MCGLIHAINDRNLAVREVVLYQYLNQKQRGHEGFGFVNIKEGCAYRTRSEEEAEIFFQLGRKGASEIALHHRFPTSTKNTTATAHPFFLSAKILKKDYFFMHNGVIHNTFNLRVEHEALEIVYESTVSPAVFNDSEALGYDFALWVEGKQPAPKSQGTIAFIAYAMEKGTAKVLQRFIYSDKSPLERSIFSGTTLTASQILSGSSPVPKRELEMYDYATQETTLVPLDFPHYTFLPAILYKKFTPKYYEDWPDTTYTKYPKQNTTIPTVLFTPRDAETALDKIETLVTSKRSKTAKIKNRTEVLLKSLAEYWTDNTLGGDQMEALKNRYNILLDDIAYYDLEDSEIYEPEPIGFKPETPLLPAPPIAPISCEA